MEITWDNAKALSNERKHGVEFLFATAVFDDHARIESLDRRRDYGEDRHIVLGQIDGRLYMVVYTLRDDFLRLISARKANPREQKKYDRALQRRRT